MDYTINNTALSSGFFLPGSIVDDRLNLAGENQLKVILYLFRHLSDHPSCADIARILKLSESEVEDCLGFWSDCGILIGQTASPAVPTPAKSKSAHAKSEEYTREEIAEKGASDEQLQLLFREVQNRLGRPLRQAESSVLLWMYDEEGMDVSVILMLIEFAVKRGTTGVRFLEKTAVDWLNSGVETLADAERKMEEATREEICYKIVRSAFGLTHKPTPTELSNARLWVETYGFDREILEKAYNICIDTTGSYSAAYIKKILERWHRDGVKTAADIQTEKKPAAKKGDYASYDRELIDRLLNSED